MTTTPEIHKATPAPEFAEDAASVCIHCHRDIKRVPGGQGPTWVHTESGAVVGSGGIANKRLSLPNGCYVLYDRYQVEIEYRLYSKDDTFIGNYDALAAAEQAAEAPSTAADARLRKPKEPHAQGDIQHRQ